MLANLTRLLKAETKIYLMVCDLGKWIKSICRCSHGPRDEGSDFHPIFIVFLGLWY